MRLRRHAGHTPVASDPRFETVGLRRAATWGLVGLALLLLLDGTSRNRVSEVDSARAADAVEGARPAVTAALVEHLRSRNGSLSQEEQRRVVESVLRSSRRYALDPHLVTAVLLVESDARPWAESGKGAIGLMQVMPHMAEKMAEKLPLAGNLATIESNIEAGCFILAENIARLGEARGISAYFWGRNIRGDAYLEKVERTRARVRGASRT